MATPPRAGLALAGLLVAASGLAKPPPAGKPRAAVVLVGSTKGLSPREVDLVLEAALAEMRASSGFSADATASLAAGSEVASLGCELEPECLLRVAESIEVDALVAVRATAEGRKEVAFQLLWVAGDARGLPTESEAALHRTPAAIEKGVRAGVRAALPAYARKGMGGLTVLAETGSEVLVDGQRAGQAPFSEPLVVSAGIHRVDVITPSGRREARSAEVAEGRKASLDASAASEAVASLTMPPEPKGRTLRTASFLVGGAGVLSLGAGVYFGLESNSLNERIRAGECQELPCPEGMTQQQAQSLNQESSSRAMLGNVGLFTGLLFTAGAGVLYWLGSREE
ncbi:MAG: hypothetical protein HYZ28_20260 [Myxococcales bacterium]|nr:hypothetical protein [Myxococcales bacterium]